MGAVSILTPMLIGAWPAIATAISGVASSLGFAIATQSQPAARKEESSNTVETDLPNSEILEDRAGESQTMTIERDGVTIEFKRDERGGCKLCVSGKGSKADLRKIGQEVSGRVIQQFAYHKLITELKRRKCTVIEEKVQQDDSIRVRVRLNG